MKNENNNYKRFVDFTIRNNMTKRDKDNIIIVSYRCSIDCLTHFII